MATPKQLIEKYESLREHEDVRVVKALYGSVVKDMKDLQKEERSRRGLQEELDALERLREIKGPVCKRCGLPCEDNSNTTGRRGFPAAGGGLVYQECN